MKKKDYKNIGICLGIVFAWILILFFCAYRPYIGSVEKLTQEIAESDLAISEVESFWQEYGEKVKYKEKLNNNLNILEEKMPKDMAENDFLMNLNEMTQLANVQIISLNPSESSKVKQTENYSAKDWKICVKGDYFSVLAFLRQLNLSPRLIVIKMGEIYRESDYVFCKLTLQIYSANYNKK